MAHNIHYNTGTGTYSFFSVNEKAWHGLGQALDHCPTSEEALQLSGLNFEVEKRRLYTFDNANHFGNADTITPTIEVPHYYATVRTDTETPLGVVGRGYKVVQNREAFSFFDALVDSHGVQYETAGALGNGERIFITAKLPQQVVVGRDDLIEQYLFLTASHDGFGAVTAAFTPVRIVCQNTLQAALKDCSNRVKVRHTANVRERLEQAHQIILRAHQLSQSMESIFNHWAAIKVCDGELKKLIQLAMTPSKAAWQSLESKGAAFSASLHNRCNAAFEYAMSHPTQQLPTTKGTLFGAYNAVTGYFQNVCTFKSGEGKLKSLLLGGQAQITVQKAFSLCEAFTKGDLQHHWRN